MPLGIFAALRDGTFADRGMVALALGLYSIPSFVLIPLIWMANLAMFRAGYPIFPQAGWGTPSHVVLPVLVLAAANVGYITQLTRSSMLEVLRDDYVRTARAKGLLERTVIVRACAAERAVAAHYATGANDGIPRDRGVCRRSAV